MKKKIIAIIGARPQFIKHYPFELEAKKSLDLVTIHTGQHYDANMSQVFFDQLGMSKPDYLLSLGGGNHGEQTGKMLIEIEKIVLAEKPDAIVVYGDTNSTLAGALVASKLHIKLIHIEAGLRSYNKEMPEEVNRILTDHISDLLLVPSDTSVLCLAKEGITEGVHIVGDIMKDLVQISTKRGVLQNRPLDYDYYYATLHRPYNVDDKDRLISILESLKNLSKKVVFAIHPRTRIKIREFNIDFEGSYSENIELIEPQPYFENLNFLHHSVGLITDSGGMQKEAYWLEKPCVTIRKETEWIETLEGACNQLVFEELDLLGSMLGQKSDHHFKPDLYGEGIAAKKIVNEILNLI